MKAKALFLTAIMVMSMVAPVAAVGMGDTSNDVSSQPQKSLSSSTTQANNTTIDVSDEVGVNLPPGKKMKLTIHDLDTDDPVGTMFEWSGQVDSDTVQKITLKDVRGLDNISYFEIYKDGDKVETVPFYKTSNLFDSALGGGNKTFPRGLAQSELKGIRPYGATGLYERPNWEEETPFVISNGNNLEIFMYAENNSQKDYGVMKLYAVPQEDARLCEGKNVEINSDGQFVNFSNDYFEGCQEVGLDLSLDTGDVVGPNGTTEVEPINNTTININNTVNGDYPSIGGLTGATRVTFDADVVFTNQNGQEISETERGMTVIFDEQFEVEDLTASNERFLALKNITKNGESITFGSKNDGEYPIAAKINGFGGGELQDQAPLTREVASDVYRPRDVEIRNIRNIDSESFKVTGGFDINESIAQNVNISVFGQNTTRFINSDNFTGTLTVEGIQQSSGTFTGNINVTYTGSQSSTDVNFTVDSVTGSSTTTIGDTGFVTMSSGETRQFSLSLNASELPDSGLAQLSLLERESGDTERGLVDRSAVFLTENQPGSQIGGRIFNRSNDFQGDLSAPFLVENDTTFDSTLNVTANNDTSASISVFLIGNQTNKTYAQRLDQSFTSGNEVTYDLSGSVAVENGTYRLAVVENQPGESPQVITGQLIAVQSSLPDFNVSGPGYDPRFPEAQGWSGSLLEPSLYPQNDQFQINTSVTSQTTKTRNFSVFLFNRSTQDQVAVLQSNATISGTETLSFDSNTGSEPRDVDVDPGFYTATLTVRQGGEQRYITTKAVSVGDTTGVVDPESLYDVSSDFSGSIASDDRLDTSQPFDANANITNNQGVDVNDTQFRVALVNGTYSERASQKSLNFTSGETLQETFTGNDGALQDSFDVEASPGLYNLVLLEKNQSESNYSLVDAKVVQWGEPEGLVDPGRLYNVSSDFSGDISADDILNTTQPFDAETTITNNQGRTTDETDFRVALVNASYSERASQKSFVFTSGETRQETFTGNDGALSDSYDISASPGLYNLVLLEKNQSETNYTLVDAKVVQWGDRGLVELDPLDPTIVGLNRSDEVSGSVDGPGFIPQDESVNFTTTTTFSGGSTGDVTLRVALANSSERNLAADTTETFDPDETRSVTLVGGDESDEINVDNGFYQIILLEQGPSDSEYELVAQGPNTLVGENRTNPTFTIQNPYDQSDNFTGSYLSYDQLIARDTPFNVSAEITSQVSSQTNPNLRVALIKGSDSQRAAERQVTFLSGETRVENFTGNDAGLAGSYDVDVQDGFYSLALLEKETGETGYDIINTETVRVIGSYPNTTPTVRIPGRLPFDVSRDMDGSVSYPTTTSASADTNFTWQVTSKVDNESDFLTQVALINLSDSRITADSATGTFSPGETQSYDGLMPAGRAPSPGIYTVVLLERRNASDPWEGVASSSTFVVTKFANDTVPKDGLNLKTRVRVRERVEITNDQGSTENVTQIVPVVYDGDVTVKKVSITNENIVGLNGDTLTFTKDINALYRNGSVSASKQYTQEVTTSYSNVQDVNVTVGGIESKRILYVVNNTTYPTFITQNNTTIINPISNITVTNNTTIDSPFVDVPGGESVLWQTCNTAFERPRGKDEVNRFYTDDTTRVGLRPNEVRISDFSDTPISNVTYPYPASEEGVNISEPFDNHTMTLYPDRVYVTGCVYVVDGGDGVTLPSIIGNSTFDRFLNTYYLNTEMKVGPFGRISEYINPIEDKEAVSGFTTNPRTGNVTVNITKADRSLSTQFGESVFEFTMEKDEGRVVVKIQNLQPNREYTLYEDGSPIQREVAGPDGSVSFVKDGGWSKHEYDVVVGERKEGPQGGQSQLGQLIPEVSLTTPAIVFLAALGILLAVAAYLYYRREQDDTGTIKWE